jgi:hypothetical protein
VRILLTKSERLTLFVQPPVYWDFTFEPRFYSVGDEMEFIEPLWGRKCAKAIFAGVTFNKGAPKEWRVALREFTDLRDHKVAVLEDGRMRLLGVGARLQGIRREYNTPEVLQYMLRLAMLVCEDKERKAVQDFLRANPVPAPIRKLGYRQIVDDLMRSIEVQ